MNNKRGASGNSQASVIFGAVIIGIIVLVVVFSVLEYYVPGDTENAEAGIGATGKVLGTVVSLGENLISYVYKIVTPSDLDENERTIAFAIFLLMLVIGTYSLRWVPAFKNFWLAALVSFLISLMGSKGLSSYLIKTYLVGAPLSGMVVLATVIPLLMVYGAMSKWKHGSFITKLIVWLFIAAIYFLVYNFALDSPGMGFVTAGFIAIAAVVETLAPYFREFKRERNQRGLGRFMASSQQTLKNWKSVQEGAEESQ